MKNNYPGVNTRFLHNEERLIISQEQTMPLVIEAQNACDATFLKEFLAKNSKTILKEVSLYSAVLFRGFSLSSEEDLSVSRN